MTLRDDYNRDGYVKTHLKSLEGFPAKGWWEGNLELKFQESVDEYINFVRDRAKAEYFQQMFLKQPILNTLFKLGVHFPSIISHPSLHILSPNLHIENGYNGTSAHQDWASTQGSLNSITVWIALMDISEKNYPLEVIPGSHKRGLLEGKMNGSVLEVEADDKEFVPINAKSGDVVFISGFTVHRTGAGSGFRMSVSQRFNSGNEPTFIERGYPCAQKRVVEREITWKPTVEQVVKVFK